MRIISTIVTAIAAAAIAFTGVTIPANAAPSGGEALKDDVTVKAGCQNGRPVVTVAATAAKDVKVQLVVVWRVTDSFRWVPADSKGLVPYAKDTRFERTLDQTVYSLGPNEKAIIALASEQFATVSGGQAITIYRQGEVTGKPDC